jgi:hypothetical protein
MEKRGTNFHSTALQNARNLFEVADVDGSGQLDQEELRSFLETLSKVGWTVAVDEEKLLQGSSRGISFAAFASGAQDLLRLPPQDQEAIMQRLSKEWQRSDAALAAGHKGGSEAGTKSGGGGGWGWGGGKQAKYEARFADMIRTVETWKRAPSPSGSPPAPLVCSCARACVRARACAHTHTPQARRPRSRCGHCCDVIVLEMSCQKAARMQREQELSERPPAPRATNLGTASS